jgi:hypothetical protein
MAGVGMDDPFAGHYLSAASDRSVDTVLRGYAGSPALDETRERVETLGNPPSSSGDGQGRPTTGSTRRDGCSGSWHTSFRDSCGLTSKNG